MVLTLYGNPVSAPYRLTLMAAEAVGVDYKVRVLQKGEHTADWFVKVRKKEGDLYVLYYVVGIIYSILLKFKFFSAR